MTKMLRVVVIGLVMAVSVTAHAGENVVLRDAAGRVLKPTQLDSVSIAKTCGDCHDVADKARSVHFDRKSGSADPEGASCLACHLNKGKDAFTSDGAIRKTIAGPSESACLSCHTDKQAWAHQTGGAHEGMACVDCHKNAGHKASAAATCIGCHNGSTKAPVPAHLRFPALHMTRLQCEACHIRHLPEGVPGYVLIRRRVAPVDIQGQPVHHGVAKAGEALGAGGCVDCHSEKSHFFFGTTSTGGTTTAGKPAVISDYRSLHQSRLSVLIAAARERFVKPISGWVFIAVILMSIGHYLIFGPHRTKTPPDDPEVLRFTPVERMVHLLAIVAFVILGLTGLAFLLHLESPGSHLRAIHGCVGPFFVAAVVGILVAWWKNALFVSCDKEWIYKLGGYLWVRGECPAEKFNAGQKLFYWAIAVLGGAAISVTGVCLLIGRGYSPSWVYTAHDLAAIALIGGIIGHAYLSIFANPGTVHSMLTGRVKRTWAQRHHPNWLWRIESQRDKKPDGE